MGDQSRSQPGFPFWAARPTSLSPPTVTRSTSVWCSHSWTPLWGNWEKKTKNWGKSARWGGRKILSTQQWCRGQVRQLEERLRQSQSQAPLYNSLQLNKDFHGKIETLTLRLDSSDKRNTKTLDCLQCLSNRVENLEIIKIQVKELEEKLAAVHIQSSYSQHKDTYPLEVQQRKLDAGEVIESLKCYLTEKITAVKDLVSGPLSVVFDAIRSDDFVGEDNFLTFSKAMQFIKCTSGLLLLTSSSFMLPVSGYVKKLTCPGNCLMHPPPTTTITFVAWFLRW